MPDEDLIVIPIGELPDVARRSGLAFGADGRVTARAIVIDLDSPTKPEQVRRAHECLDSQPRAVCIGLTDKALPHELDSLADRLAFTLTGRDWTDGHTDDRRVIATDDPIATLGILDSIVRRAPIATSVFLEVLRSTAELGVCDGLTVESSAYSMLLAGAEFRRWRESCPRPTPEDTGQPRVLLTRQGDVLRMSLNRPDRHNAFDRAMRDALCEAFELVIADSTIQSVELSGRGPSFCSGGELAEFGTTRDVALAHAVRLQASVAWRIHRTRDRVRALVHGACIGAGAELPSFAGVVQARGDARFALPELSMGLIPGAGGTIGLPRRIGRWRTAWLGLTGSSIDAQRALTWGLVDHVP